MEVEQSSSINSNYGINSDKNHSITSSSYVGKTMTMGRKVTMILIKYIYKYSFLL